MADAFGNALGYALAAESGQAAGSAGKDTQIEELRLAAANSGQGLRLRGGQGLVIDGMRAVDTNGITANDLRLLDMHSRDDNPYAQVVANGAGELLTGQDYWNQARNQADSALTGRYQVYYTQEAAQIAAQRRAEAAQAATAQNQYDAEGRSSWLELAAQAQAGGSVAGTSPGAGFVDGSGGAAVGYLRAGRRADPNGMTRAITNWDSALAGGVDAIHDFAVDARIPVLSPALYMAAGLLPRSTAELAAGAVLGPMAGRAIGAGIGLLNGAAAGTFLATDLGAVTGRALNEVAEFAAERLGRLHEGLGLQPALIEITGVKVTNSVVHKNSLEYVGDTHVYRVIGPDGTTYKIGESAQGVRLSDGASIRAEQQVRALQRETGDVYKSEILREFTDKASARQYETQLIERFRRIYGDGALPGNKTNR